MKMFEIVAPGASPRECAVDIEQVILGAEGRGRRKTIVPITGAGTSYRAARTDSGVVLARGNWPEDGRCLCVVNTRGEYDRHRHYGVFDAKGINILAEGWDAFGEAGNLGSQPHVLVTVEDGAEFRLNSKYASHWYRWLNGEWLVESTSQRKARLAIEALDRGEVEWL
jgi:hypothetical protein